MTIASRKYYLNTSNSGKLKEFKNIFSSFGCELIASEISLKEIKSDKITVIIHKASQLKDYTLVDDTSLEIFGTNFFDVEIKQHISYLNQYINRKAIWTVLLGMKIKENIFIYRGQISGVITSARGHAGFGFDPFFQPDGTDKTLAEDKPFAFNARYQAVKMLIENKPFSISKPILSWQGEWQEE